MISLFKTNLCQCFCWNCLNVMCWCGDFGWFRLRCNHHTSAISQFSPVDRTLANFFKFFRISFRFTTTKMIKNDIKILGILFTELENIKMANAFWLTLWMLECLAVCLPLIWPPRRSSYRLTNLCFRIVWRRSPAHTSNRVFQSVKLFPEWLRPTIASL